MNYRVAVTTAQGTTYYAGYPATLTLPSRWYVHLWRVRCAWAVFRAQVSVCRRHDAQLTLRKSIFVRQMYPLKGYSRETPFPAASEDKMKTLVILNYQCTTPMQIVARNRRRMNKIPSDISTLDRKAA